MIERCRSPKAVTTRLQGDRSQAFIADGHNQYDVKAMRRNQAEVLQRQPGTALNPTELAVHVQRRADHALTTNIPPSLRASQGIFSPAAL